jgi:type II secretory pathway pseudopilin PulG
MAALLVGMSVMAVAMTVALPVWSTAAKRAREDELVFRGEQYARAIGMYQRKYANALPPSIDVLVNERFLRKKYLDPVTNSEFQALTGAVGQGVPGPAGAGRGGAGTGGAGGARTGGAATGARGAGQTQSGFGSPATQTGSGFGATAGAGGIVGVASKSTEKSLRQYNGRGAYNEWTFVAVQRQTQAGTGAEGGAAGAQGRGGRGGERGTQATGEPARRGLVPSLWQRLRQRRRPGLQTQPGSLASASITAS